MSGKELVKRMEKAGWKLSRITGSHHVMAKGAKTVTVPVHANRDIPKGLLMRLLKEADL